MQFLIYISMRAGYMEHLCMCLLATCVFSSVKCLFQFCSFSDWIVWYFLFWLCQCLIYASIFLQVHCLSLHPLNIVFHRKKNDEVQFTSFPFVDFAFGVKFKNYSPSPSSAIFYQCLFCFVVHFISVICLNFFMGECGT